MRRWWNPHGPKAEKWFEVHAERPTSMFDFGRGYAEKHVVPADFYGEGHCVAAFEFGEGTVRI